MQRLELQRLPKWITEDPKVSQLTDPSVRQTLGSEVHDFVQSVDTDALIFLDKSARPAAWMFRQMWHGVFPNTRVPDVYFLNIGREKINRVTALCIDNWPSRIESYTEQNQGLLYAIRDGFRVGVTDRTYLDGKSVCVVDEHVQYGFTLPLARHMVGAVLGDRIKGDVQTAEVFSSSPPWYSMDPDEDNLIREDLTGVCDIMDESAVFTSRWRSGNVNKWFRSQLRGIVSETLASQPTNLLPHLSC